MANTHLIGKQVFELELGSEDNSYAIQQGLSDMVWRDLAPKLSALFDGVAGEKEVVRINKIELNLGLIASPKTGGDEIANRIVQLLEEEFSKSGNFSAGDKYIVDEKLPRNTQQPLRKRYFDIWLYWLLNGTLPPYSIEPDKNWLELIFETLGIDDKAIIRLAEKIKRHPIALERLVMQHKPKDLKSIVELYTGHSQARLLQLFIELKPHINRGLEIQLWKLICKKVIVERKKLDSTALGLEIMKQPSIQKLRNKIQDLSESSGKYPLLKELFKMHGPGDTNTNREETQTPESLEDLGLETTESPQFFHNAGVVLLHPFLKPLFEKLKLLKGTEFKDHKCRSKAVVLIQFLATGKEIIPEYEMVLPKFLCDMPTNVPIDHTLKLSKKEKEEATKLLKVTIDHWGALGKSSPDGLREGFLIRDGKLKKEQSGWKLYVEQKAQDILLDKLPWNLSVIKLPWMKEILKVEWR